MLLNRILAVVSFVSVLVPMLGQEQRSGSFVLVEAWQYSHCSDCPPWPTHDDFMFCFRTEGTVLIGRKSSRGKMLVSLEGRTVPLKYDKDHIFVSFPGGTTIELNQHYTSVGFRDCSCDMEVARRILANSQALKRPKGVHPDAVPVVHRGLLEWWDHCWLDSAKDEIHCTIWPQSGGVLDNGIFLLADESRKISAADLVIDPYQSEYDFIHLQNGAILIPKLGYEFYREKLKTRNSPCQ